MSTLNKLTVIPPPATNAEQSTSPQPTVKAQGNHQVLFNGGVNSISTPRPPVVVVNGLGQQKKKEEEAAASVLSTSSTKSLLNVDEDEDDEIEDDLPVKVTTPQQHRASRKTQPRATGRSATKKTTKTPSAGTKLTSAKQVASALASSIKLSEFIDKTDNKGTKWMKKVPVHKLNEIPTDARHNEVEFVNWRRFDKDFVIYQLYTARGVKYWATFAATQWLDAATEEGYTPANCTFVVKNDKEEGLCYGFRYKDAPQDKDMEVDN